jgi:hypothetical protein
VARNSLWGDVLHSFTRGRLTGPTLLISVAAAVLLMASAAPGQAPAPPPPTAPAFVSGPTVTGDAVVGSTLTAEATWTGEPAPKVKYQWRRFKATGGQGDAIVGATAAQYVVTAADVGFRLGVHMTLKNSVVLTAVAADSVTTAVVTVAPTPTPPPGPPPPPDPDPEPDPGSTTDPTAGSATSQARTSFTEPVAPIVDVTAAPTLLRPFPIVRIRGYFKRRGVRVTLLSVTAPASARIAARCIGKGCPISALSLSHAPARLRPFERYLRAGTLLQVRVTSQGRIGKYASFRIRSRSAPLRKDLCVTSGRAKPAACPTR